MQAAQVFGRDPDIEARVFAKRGFGIFAVPCEQRHCVRDAGGLAGFVGTEDFLLFLVELVIARIGFAGCGVALVMACSGRVSWLCGWG